MKLSNTIEMMVSEDYTERFKAEYYQLKIRYEKLKDMLERWDTNQLMFAPTCPRSIYRLQTEAMLDYLAVLEARAKIEGIEL